MKNAGIKHTPCSLISCYKNDYERRIMAVPHIATYVMLAKEIENNKLVIMGELLSNTNSYSNEIRPYEIDSYDIKSNFFKNYLDRTKFSLGFKYLLKVDISKCYENIYTHSITWALLGKEKAKKEHNKKKDSQSKDFIKFDQIDARVRAINNNETKGIPTGPLTSRIISEIVLMGIDNEIRKMNPYFKRFVDDYNFYFRSKAEAEAFIPRLQKVLYEYKLHLNSEKTEILRYPYSVNHNLSYELGNYDFNKYGYVNFIERFNELFIVGNKGALKFGLKVLKSECVPEKEKEMVFAHLINLMVSYPNLSEYIYSIMIKNDFDFDEKTTDVLNEVLKVSITNNHHIEVIWLLTFMMKFDVEIHKNNIEKTIEELEVFSTILVLDYIFEFELYNDAEIKENLKDLRVKLKDESIYGEKWMLIYEANYNSWIKGIKGKLKECKLLERYYDKGKSFYVSLL